MANRVKKIRVKGYHTHRRGYDVTVRPYMRRLPRRVKRSRKRRR